MIIITTEKTECARFASTSIMSIYLFIAYFINKEIACRTMNFQSGLQSMNN